MKTTGNVTHNHCMKADPEDPLPFCYTTDPKVRYEYCNCEDSSNDGDYSYYQGNDGQYKNYGGDDYGVNNEYSQYGQYGGANGGYNYAPGGQNHGVDSQNHMAYKDAENYSGLYGPYGGIYSNTRYHPWANPLGGHYNPYGPYGYVWHQGHQHERCSVSKTIEGSVRQYNLY